MTSNKYKQNAWRKGDLYVFQEPGGNLTPLAPTSICFACALSQDQTDQTHHGSFKPSSYRTEKPGLLYIQEEQWTLPIVFLRGGDG